MQAVNSLPARNFQQNLLAMLGLCLVLIMVALDQTVVGTALPTIVAELNGFNLYAWVGTSYLLTSVISIPIFGKLGDEHGRKPFVMAAIIVFTVASILCGIAQTMLELVLARGLQGIGGGMLVATAFTCVPDLFPDPHERLRWQVLFSSAFGLANAIGPSLGGFLTEYWGWRWVFFVNLPVGILSLWFIWQFLPLIKHHAAKPSPLDWQGSLLIATLLGSLQLLVEWLPQQHSPITLIALGIISAASLVTLIQWEKRSPNPVLPLDMFADRSIGTLFVLSLMMGFCLFAIMYYAPLMFQGGFGLSPNQAGLLVTPLVVCITVGSILNGRIVSRLKTGNIMLYAGFILFGLCALGLTQINPTTPHGLIISIMLLGGIGLGFLMPNLTIFVQLAAPQARMGISTAVLQSMRMVGGMLGTALVGTLVTHLYVNDVTTLAQTHGQPQVAHLLADPQILVNTEKAQQLRQYADGVSLLDSTRHILIQSIHHSQWLVLIVLLLASLLVKRVPPFQIKRRK